MGAAPGAVDAATSVTSTHRHHRRRRRRRRNNNRRRTLLYGVSGRAALAHASATIGRLPLQCRRAVAVETPTPGRWRTDAAADGVDVDECPGTRRTGRPDGQREEYRGTGSLRYSDKPSWRTTITGSSPIIRIIRYSGEPCPRRVYKRNWTLSSGVQYSRTPRGRRNAY